jgi:hypothetical protein
MDPLASRLRQAFELTELAEGMLRQRLRREHPTWSDKTLAREIERWRLTRPGAEHGDAVGRARPLRQLRRASSSKR